MPQQDPLSYPATILKEDRHLDSYDNYLEQLVNNVALEQQRKELKDKQVKDSLIPPEVDWKNLFPGDTKEVMNKLGEYEATGTKWWDQGIDWSDPRNHDAYQERLGLESSIRDMQLYSAQDKELYKNAVTKMSETGFDKGFSRTQSQENVAKWASQGGIEARKKYRQEKGSLLIEAEFDPFTYGSEVVKKYNQAQFNDDPKKRNGFLETSTTTKWTPEQEATIALDLLEDERMKSSLEGLYNQLSEDKKSEYVQQAMEKNMGSGLEAYAVGFAYRFKPEVEKTQYQKLATGSTGNSNNQPKESSIVSTIAGVRSLNSNYVYDTQISGKSYKKSDSLDGMVIGKYDNRKPRMIRDENGADVVVKKVENGAELTQYDRVQEDEIIEDMFYDPEQDQWYISTNKIKNQKLGVNVPGYGYAYPMSDAEFTDLLKKVAKNSGEYNEETIWNDLNKQGKVDNNGIVTFDKIMPKQRQSEQFQLGD